MRPSVKVGGGAIGVMQASRPIGSSGVSRVPFLPVPLGIGFPAQFRRVSLGGMALASVGGQANKKRVLRKLQPMPTPASPAHSWACCAGLVNLRPTRRSTGRRSALRLRHAVVPAPLPYTLGVIHLTGSEHHECNSSIVILVTERGVSLCSSPCQETPPTVDCWTARISAAIGMAASIGLLVAGQQNRQ